MADLDPIVAALRERREARDWSQRYVAELTGIPRPQVAKWEIGINRPTLGLLRRWCGALGYELTLTDMEDGT